MQPMIATMPTKVWDIYKGLEDLKKNKYFFSITLLIVQFQLSPDEFYSIEKAIKY